MLHVPRPRFLPETADKELAARARAVREAKGMSLDEVATAVGIKRNTLSRYETCKRGIPNQTLRKMEALLGPLRDIGPVRPLETSPVSGGPASLPRSPIELGGYSVKTAQGIEVGIRLDGIEDEALRKRVAMACHAKIQELLDPPGAHAGAPSRVRRPHP